MDQEIKLLLVEDSEEDADLIALALKRGGLNATLTRVDTRAGMEQAIDYCSWDAVVADYSARLEAFLHKRNGWIARLMREAA